MGRFGQLPTDPRSPLSDHVEATVRLQDMARARRSKRDRWKNCERA